MHDLLPENLINAIRSSNEDADRWIAEFPNLLDHFVQRWNLELASAPVECESILVVTHGLGDRPICPGCLKTMDREGDVVSCQRCHWSTTIDAFRKSHRKRRLIAGRMQPFIEAFVEDFKRARGLRDKMRLIDILLHQCHGEYEQSGLRPGAINLIGGKPREVVELLDRLAGFRRSELAEKRHHDVWVSKVRQERKVPYTIRIPHPRLTTLLNSRPCRFGERDSMEKSDPPSPAVNQTHIPLRMGLPITQCL